MAALRLLGRCLGACLLLSRCGVGRGDGFAPRAVLSDQGLAEFDARWDALMGSPCATQEQQGSYWGYELCPRDGTASQYHGKAGSKRGDKQRTTILLGEHDRRQEPEVRVVGAPSSRRAGPSRSAADMEARLSYGSGDPCEGGRRSVEVVYACCGDGKATLQIAAVAEPTLCRYEVRACSAALCDVPLPSSDVARLRTGEGEPPREARRAGKEPNLTGEQVAALREKAKEMFYHGYDKYIEHAAPDGELRPLTCKGGSFGLSSIPYVTLVDALDTLAVMGNSSEFFRVVDLVSRELTFQLDVNVSVFETNIRVLGGLLSAHAIATDPPFPGGEGYSGGLLAKAVDLADRLLPAFATPTGIPYGTVNLQRGVPRGETDIASTAGAGTLSLEFAYLSALTGDRRYVEAGDRAALAIWQRRSALNLVGKHLSVLSGGWTEPVSGIGANADSFYEYLAKRYILFDEAEPWLRLYLQAEEGLEAFLRSGDYYSDVDMFTGEIRRQRAEGLHAFLPGLQLLLGGERRIDGASRALKALFLIRDAHGFLPEQFDFVQFQLVSEPRAKSHPLRPELLESVYFMHRMTKDPAWRNAGARALEALEDHARTDCGYAAIADVHTLSKSDEMPSFFLSETAKYLYLLFSGDDHWIHTRAVVFSTEAHPFPTGRGALTLSSSAASSFAASYEGKAAPLSRADTTCAPPALHQISMMSYTRDFTDAVGDRSLARAEPPQPPGVRGLLGSFRTRFRTKRSGAERRGGAQAAVQRDQCDAELHAGTPGAFSAPSSASFDADDFTVSTFRDGFIVEKSGAEGDGGRVEVSYVQDGMLFLRSWADGGADGDGVPLVLDNSGLEARCALIHGSGARDMEFCTPASFGPTFSGGGELGFGTLQVTGALVHGGDGCARVAPGLYSGSLVVLDRGRCMFEEKVKHAQEGGAAAVVVVNSEEGGGSFVMAGETSLARGPTSIPAVMLRSAARDQLRRLCRIGGVEATIAVDVRASPEVLAGALRHDGEAPAFQTPENARLRRRFDRPLTAKTDRGLLVVGHGSWGVLITGGSDGENAHLLVADLSVGPLGKALGPVLQTAAAAHP